MNTISQIIELKDIIQDCHLNFLFGSGMSMPFLSTLGNIEILLTELSQGKELGLINDDQEEIIRTSLYKKYFEDVILKNLEILNNEKLSFEVLNEYERFLRLINSILQNRRTPILNKQVNLFSTNIDIFLEKALENTNVEYNDGFNGRFNPTFSTSNFRKSFFKTSLHYDIMSELPVFNLFKLHGSLTWNKDNNKLITLSSNLETVAKIKSLSIPNNKLIKVNKDTTIKDLILEASKKKKDVLYKSFISEYENLAIVNPTKEKFKETLLNRNYYDLLRIYSNELEKENTVLFVIGFSFADEHIRVLTKMAADSNPTLKIYIFSHTNNISEGIQLIKEGIKNNNIEIVSPTQKINIDKIMVDEFNFDFKNINTKIFGELFNYISSDIE